MRILDAAKIPYEVLEYTFDENDLRGTLIAEQLLLPYDMVFKTLVAKGDKTGHLVLCIPVHREIDLKLAASMTGRRRNRLYGIPLCLAWTPLLTESWACSGPQATRATA